MSANPKAGQCDSLMLNQDRDKLASILGHCGPAYHMVTDHKGTRLLLVTIETRHPKQVAVTGKEQDIQNAATRGGYMAWWVRCVLCKREDLSSHPSIHIKV